jgi:hypothetical protein
MLENALALGGRFGLRSKSQEYEPSSTGKMSIRMKERLTVY